MNGSVRAFAPAIAVLTCCQAVWGASAADVRGMLDRYCVTCHNDGLRSGGLALNDLDFAQPAQHAERWEKVVSKLRAGTMPPAGSPRPAASAYSDAAKWIETELDRDQLQKPYAGRPLLHRLNRAEYGNAIRDVLGLEVDVEALLPPDDSAFGFDNISEALGLSPALQERYLSAATKLAALAVGDPEQTAASRTWRIRQDLSQNQHIEGLPLGTVGGTVVRHQFPLDGDYQLQATLYRTNLNIVRGLQTKIQVEFSIDGKRVHVAAIGGPEDLASLFERPTDTSDEVNNRLRVTVPVSAGAHTVAVAFVQNPQSAEPVRLQPFLRSSVDNFDWAGHPHLQTLTVAGPFRPTGMSETSSRKRVFVCSPASEADEVRCARQIVSGLVRRAYRRPAAEADVARAMRFYEGGREGAGKSASRKRAFDAGIESAIARVLSSPLFLFRAEGKSNQAARKLTGLELASRLSFFLWSSVPDDRLIDLGARGTLLQPAVLEREVRRMIVDPKARALKTNFPGQWLQLRNLRNFQPNTDRFPDFDDNLRMGFQRETELLFESVIAEDRSVVDLLTADYTFLNERLARHYGVPGIYGSHFRRVAVTGEQRQGLLGHGSVLALTSKAERTSPVVRGKWILENLLGQTVPAPPANVPPLKEKQDGEKPRTMREQMAEHRTNPVCAACHKALDPIGFALENFDAVGAWRTQDSGLKIDATGELADGMKVDGVNELRRTLVRDPAMFASTVTAKLMTYALGRGLDYRDAPRLRAIVRGAATGRFKFSDLLMGIVRSPQFQMTSEAPPKA